ncbi:hypothetical protein NEUTE1DRAFT_100166 [Neurospora tetrasperma FGSC 2508]|uniref:Uncharacterized protein n=1 Tax=Neurospora tetrasperma (strain FGSC 2508 / ATCC MYA-4615 / P0657) TaxID=510951 RepID=F8MN25_NEUT8|nr:uncharacterized protein NEUTE1DRAFT_100166 [Neurospora tetrasperma FGSC 2508]EGO57198.1 hypothetical protein NEUTE1DRAFT_100166 [Neurospora tetrasperma FGSC 2508]
MGLEAVKTCQLLLISAHGFYGDDISAASGAENHDQDCIIDLVARPGQASWEVEGLARHTPDLKLDCFVDTTDRTAFFSLRGQCTLKTSTPAHVSLFLFIYPEDIQSLEVSYTSSPLPHPEEQEAVPDIDRFIRLRFIITQPPSLVAPKHQPLQPKHRSEALFDALQSLATVKDISFYLDLSSLPIEIQAQLACLPSIFSSANIHSRPRTHVNRASLVRLYGGAGGQTVNPSTTAREPGHHEVQEAQPGSPTLTTSGVLQDAAPTSTQTRKRSASASGFLPPYHNRHDERDIASSSNLRLFESAQENASPSQELTQFSPTPDRNGKRPRLATPSDLDLPSLPPTPTAADFLEASTDPSKFYTIRQQLLTRITALETRNEQLLTRNVTLEARVEHSSKLEDWFRLEVRQRVGGEVTRQLDKLHHKTGRKWEEEIRQEVRDQITQDVKEELYEDASKHVLQRIAAVLVEAVDGSGWLVPGSTACENLLSRSVVPGENALYTAVADVQKTHAGEMSEEEMARVIDYLEENPLSAVKYNACRETMRRYFVGQWKATRKRTWGVARW